jgi:hypothetical protein
MLRSILNYLTPKDIGTLDNATTNQRDRELWLIALEKFQMEMIFPDHQDKLDSEIRWLLLRGIIINQATVWPGLEHPCWIDLIQRSRDRIHTICVRGFDFYEIQSEELLLALVSCPNISSFTLIHCQIDELFMDCLSKMPRLQSLTIPFRSSWIPSIPLHCPQLQTLTLENDYDSLVSDEELRLLLENCSSLRTLRLDDADFTDESIPLLIKSSHEGKIISWRNCPGVNWDQKLLYLREISLGQLFSDDVKQQTTGISAFASMIPSPLIFPVEEYNSMGVFLRIYDLLLKLKTEHELISSSVPQFLPILTLLEQLVQTGNVSLLVDMGFVDLMMSIQFASDESLRVTTYYWLDFILKISKTHESQYLLSHGILSELMRVGQVNHSLLSSFLLSSFSLSSFTPSPLPPFPLATPGYEPIT